ncbi:MAG: L-ribulose-5-phosphate 4-epimerase AraD [Verrucomicrobia bacterium]|nr:L-ribulose-5-phosphate 4-epimerase AraD [Verrucomicrobiota bacterium]
MNGNYLALREECCEANKQLPKLGIVDLTFGNVSVGDPELGAVAIKPSGVPYETLTPDDICVMDFNAQPDDDFQMDLEAAKLFGSLRPSSDTPTHLRLFQAFPHVRAVVHTHSRNATAFAQAGRGIPCMGTTHADYFYGEVPVTRRMTPEEISRHYEWETGNLIVETIADKDPEQIKAVLLNGHAPFVWGTSGAKAIETAYALEIIAEMTWKNLVLNPDSESISQAQLDKHYLRKHGDGAYYGQR